MLLRLPGSTLFPYTTLFRSSCGLWELTYPPGKGTSPQRIGRDRKSTRLNSSHGSISYAVFCLKKKNQTCKVRNALDHQSLCGDDATSDYHGPPYNSSHILAT